MAEWIEDNEILGVKMGELINAPKGVTGFDLLSIQARWRLCVSRRVLITAVSCLSMLDVYWSIQSIESPTSYSSSSNHPMTVK